MEFFKTNTKRREILIPLFDWRYLGLSEIQEASGYRRSRVGLQRMMQRLEKDGLVESFLHELANRKFYSLSKKTFRNYSDRPWFLNPDISNHDAITSSFLFQIKKLDQVVDASLNFPEGFLKENSGKLSVEPDGFFTAIRNGNPIKFALEIELHRKSSTMIESKYERYYKTTDVDGVIYVFSDLSILQAYFQYHEDFLTDRLNREQHSRIAFCFTDNLGSSQFDFLNMKRINSNGQLDTFGSIFL